VCDQTATELSLDAMLSSLCVHADEARADPIHAQYAYVHYGDVRRHAPHSHEHMIIVVRSPHASHVHVHSPNEAGVSPMFTRINL
jgi:hypothetical protein